jgi:hypothetical protein
MASRPSSWRYLELGAKIAYFAWNDWPKSSNSAGEPQAHQAAQQESPKADDQNWEVSFNGLGDIYETVCHPM